MVVAERCGPADGDQQQLGNWRDRNVLVTGGAGFVGSSLCLSLAAQGARVTAIDGFIRGSGANHANLACVPSHLKIDLVEVDLRTADLRSYCRGTEFVFNLAGQVSHMSAQNDPFTDLDINAAAQLRLIEALRTHAPDAVVIHTSTRQVYGRPARLPVAEDHPVNPPDFNAISKLAGEQYWLLEHRTNGRRVVILRLTNCYGPRQYIRDASHSFLGSWIGSFISNQPFEVWGGNQMRDPLFVDDTVTALLAAAVSPCYGKVFNVGGPAAVSLRQIASKLTAGKDAFTILEMPKGLSGNNRLVYFDARSYQIVPFTVEVVTCHVDGGHLVICNDDALGVFVGVEFTAHGQASVGGSGAD